eukprot:gene4062-5805_t
MASSKSGILSVKGAKYSRKNQDERPLDKIQQQPKGIDYPPLSQQLQQFSSTQQNGNKGNYNSNFSGLLPNNLSLSTLKGQTTNLNSISTSPINSNNNLPLASTINNSAAATTVGSALKSEGALVNDGKYWKLPSASIGGDDIVVIHVCDENQQLTRDFCCKRDILVNHMKYFEKFLLENESGYDDIDISVHCDVEIFEWLMTYIHEPDNPPQIDKSIIVSILISSEFLQMESLVDLCIQHVGSNLNEIIKLPIDLSCISEKLINKITQLASPQILSETKDRKDKILTKLYKRRVELDFSRKGTSTKTTNGIPFNNNTGNRTIAAYLTCCKYCGTVYLDNFVSFLYCRSSPPTIDFRGNLSSRHAAIAGWSLTAYLKALHSGGMGWDAIYWHVWAACIVFRVDKIMISVLEVDRYTVEQDGLVIRSSVSKDNEVVYSEDDNPIQNYSSSLSPGNKSKSPLPYSLDKEDDTTSGSETFKLVVKKNYDLPVVSAAITSTLNPLRPPEVLTQEILDLIRSQMKYIVGLTNKQLIQTIMNSMVEASKSNLSPAIIDYYDLLWGGTNGTGTNGDIMNGEMDDSNRRRGRSPAGRISLRGASVESRKGVATSSNKTRNSISIVNNGSGIGSENDSNENESERRSRSMGTIHRNSSSQNNSLNPFKVLSNSSNGISNTSIINNKSSKNILSSRTNNYFLDPSIAHNMEILKSLSPEVQQRCLQSKGISYGMWIVTHPLSFESQPQADAIQQVQDSTLSDHKKLEWELDILREYDEKRMSRYEQYLATKRNSLLDNNFQLNKANNISKMNKGNSNNNTLKTAQARVSSQSYYNNSDAMFVLTKGVNDHYYKDRGRQPS